MKDRALMTAFFAGHVFDSVISYVGFKSGFQEIGFLKDSPYLNMSMEDRLIIAKMGIVLLMAGAYALSKEKDLKIFSRATEKAMFIGAVAVWGVQAWNVLNVVAEVVSK